MRALRDFGWLIIAVSFALALPAILVLGIYVEYVKFLAYWRIAFG